MTHKVLKQEEKRTEAICASLKAVGLSFSIGLICRSFSQVSLLSRQTFWAVSISLPTGVRIVISHYWEKYPVNAGMDIVSFKEGHSAYLKCPCQGGAMPTLLRHGGCYFKYAQPLFDLDVSGMLDHLQYHQTASDNIKSGSHEITSVHGVTALKQGVQSKQ